MYIDMRCCEYIEDSYVASYCYKANCCCYKHVIFGSVCGQLGVRIAIVTASWLLVELLYICSTNYTVLALDMNLVTVFYIAVTLVYASRYVLCVAGYVHTINDKKLAGLKFGESPKQICFPEESFGKYIQNCKYVWISDLCN